MLSTVNLGHIHCISVRDNISLTHAALFDIFTKIHVFVMSALALCYVCMLSASITLV